MSVHFVYMTAGDRDEAKKIGRLLVEERLAACVNIIDGMESLYWWQGAVQEEHETVLIAKTRGPLVEKVVGRVKEVHSYDAPCIVAWPIAAGHAAFLAWVERETSKA